MVGGDCCRETVCVCVWKPAAKQNARAFKQKIASKQGLSKERERERVLIKHQMNDLNNRDKKEKQKMKQVQTVAIEKEKW